MIRTPKSSPNDRVTTYVCTDRKRRAEVERVRSVLSDDLRKPEYQGNPNPVAGHCYVASEALYHRLGGKAAGWTPQSIRHEGGPHWYLKNQDGTILDATADQFETPVPYAQGKGCGFLTRQPSARTQHLLDRLA
ncbi:hypothetical protein JST97_36195 [bacterium]|nr:hypothetical protein [bacterium]